MGSFIWVKKSRIKKTAVILVLLFTLLCFCYWQNNVIVITEFQYSNKNIPVSFNGYKILQISDLHNKTFGKNQSILLKKTREIQPDIILITGDLIDGLRTNIDISMQYVKGAVKIAPIYYVTGNHELRSGIYTELEMQLKAAGVIILDNKGVLITKEDRSIAVLGIHDPDFFNKDYMAFYKTLNELSDKSADYFTILLSHRPELFELYVKSYVDLVFSGHAHGGQIRIPFLGGLYAPGQGIFPKLTSGLTRGNKTAMVVSRGLGNSVFPLRIFNRPEMVVVTLQSGSE